MLREPQFSIFKEFSEENLEVNYYTLGGGGTRRNAQNLVKNVEFRFGNIEHFSIVSAEYRILSPL
jgi:hypothetical protein